MNVTYTISDAQLVEALTAKGELLEAAILEAVGSLGTQLWEKATGKLAAVVRTAIGAEMLESVYLEAAQWADGVCGTSVGIDDEGQPSYIVAYVREFGGEKWYDIYPHEDVFAMAGLSGKGRISQNSAEGSIALEEGRLPHALAWVEGGATVFAKHVWHPPAKERSYLRSSLVEMQALIKDEIAGAIAEVLTA